MRKICLLVVILAVFFVTASYLRAEEAKTVVPAGNQEMATAVETAAPVAKAEAPAKAETTAKDLEAKTDENLDWVWAEVVSVNKDAKEMVVKYTNYDNDKEEQMTVLANKDTEFENVASLEEIKVGDYVSVDYKINNGKNEAVYIVVESYKEGEQDDTEM